MRSLLKKGDRNYEGIKKIRNGIEQILRPIKESVLKYEKNTDSKLKEILSEKQFKNWIRYKKKKKKELQPQRVSKNRSSTRKKRKGNRTRH